MTIYSTGEHAVSKRVHAASGVADESFTRLIDIEAADLPCAPEGYEYCMDTAIALKIRGPVDPHTDDFMSCGDGCEKPMALFWMLKSSEPTCAYLMVEKDMTRMSSGSYAFFDDSCLHALIARRTWDGLAIQLRRVTCAGT